MIHAAGRRCGPWVWYLADNEVFPALHVHTSWMDDYFHALSPEMSEIVDFHGMDLNCHILNLASVYMGSQMLWDPESQARDHLAEFCQLVFGPAVGPAVAAGYQAIAQSRCRSDYGLRDKILALSQAAADEEGGDPEADLLALEAAIGGLLGIQHDGSWIPRLPLPATPLELIGDLRAHLTEAAAYARFRLVLAAVARGERADRDLMDWERPDGFLLTAEQMRVAHHLHSRGGGNILDYLGVSGSP